MSDEIDRAKEFYETQTNEQLENHIQSLRHEHGEHLASANDFRVLADGVNRKIETIMSIIGERNYERMIKDFVLSKDHVSLLLHYGSNIDNITDSDLQISEVLEWSVGDDGITEDQEQQIAKLLNELKFAQDYINRSIKDKVFSKL